MSYKVNKSWVFLFGFISSLMTFGQGPSIQVSPTYINENLNQGETVEHTLSVTNTGDSDLNIDISLENFSSATRSANTEPLLSRLADSPVPMTCLSMDSRTGIIYAQANNGSTFYSYSSTLDQWSTVGTSPVQSGNNGGATCLNGKIYFSYSEHSTLVIYEIDSNTWETLVSPIPTGIISHDNQYIYILGKYNFYRFDPVDRTFLNLPYPSSGSSRWGGMVYYSQYLYSHSGNSSQTFSRYNILNQTWETLANIPNGAILGATVIDGEYLCYGSYGGSNLYRYDMSQETWLDSIILPFAVDDGGLVSSRTNAFFIQGQSGVLFYMAEYLGDWLSTATNSTTVQPGETEAIVLTLDANSLQSGTALADIVINSNDPAQTTLTIPVQLVVSPGAVLLSQPEAFSFSDTFTGAEKRLSGVLYNTGELDAEIIQVQTTNTQFSTDLVPQTLISGSSLQFEVIFAPDSPTLAIAQLNIQTTSGYLEIPLSGAGQLAPVIDVNPTSINISIFEMDIVNRTVSISNNGFSTLEFQNRILDETELLQNVRLAADHNGRTVASQDTEGETKTVNGQKELSVTINNISGTVIGVIGLNYFSNYTILQGDLNQLGVSVEYLTLPLGDLSSIDLIWIGEDSTLSTSDIQQVHAYLAANGNLLIVGDEASSHFNQILPPEAGIQFAPIGSFSSDTTSNISSHEVTENVATVINLSAGEYLTLLHPAISLVDFSASFQIPKGCFVALSEGSGSIIAMSNELLSDSEISSGDNRLLSIQAMEWLLNPGGVTLDPTAGSVESGTSETINLTFSGPDAGVGIHNFTMEIVSNDPVTPLTQVPITLNVIGVPNIVVDPTTLDFGDVFLGVEETLLLTIKNNGSLHLIVSSILSSHTDFTINNSAFSVAPGGQKTVSVQFTPSAAQSINADLTIESNDQQVIVPLNGVGIAPPIAQFTPTSLNVTMDLGQRVTETITVQNTGATVLEVALSIEGDDALRNAIQLPGVSVSHVQNPDGDDYDRNVSILPISSGSRNFAGNTIAYTGDISYFSTMKSDLELLGATVGPLARPITDLSSIDLLWVLDPSLSVSWSTSEIQIIHDWISYGGSLLVEGENNHSIFNLLIPDTSGINYLPMTSYLDVDLVDFLSHPINDGITTLHQTSFGGQFSLESPAETLISYPLSMGGGTAAAVSRFGTGKIVALGNEMTVDANMAYQANRQFGNQVFDWLLTSLPFSIDMSQLSVAPGTESSFNVLFNTENILGGTYTGAIVAVTNDPVLQTMRIPVQLRAVGIPEAVLDTNTLDFGTLFLGETKIRSFLISNPGTDALEVTDIILSSYPTVSFDMTQFTILPQEELTVTVSYSPDQEELINSEIQIISNIDDVFVQISANTISGPQIIVSPESYNLILIGGYPFETILEVGNIGPFPLQFNINVTPLSLDILVIGDNGSESDLIAVLEEEGHHVDLVADDSIYIGTNPSPSSYDSIILLDGVDYGDDMPEAGQQHILDYVEQGGGIALFEWLSFEVFSGRYQILSELILLESNQTTGGTVTYELNGKHPVTTALPSSFDMQGAGTLGNTNSGQALFSFANDGGDGLVAERYGLGRVLHFSFAGNASGFQPFINPEIRNLLKNAVNWISAKPMFTEYGHHSLNQGSIKEIPIVVDTTHLTQGSHTIPINIISNDPSNGSLTIPLYIEIPCVLSDQFFMQLSNWGIELSITELIDILNQDCQGP